MLLAVLVGGLVFVFAAVGVWGLLLIQAVSKMLIDMDRDATR